MFKTIAFLLMLFSGKLASMRANAQNLELVLRPLKTVLFRDSLENNLIDSVLMLSIINKGDTAELIPSVRVEGYEEDDEPRENIYYRVRYSPYQSEDESVECFHWMADIDWLYDPFSHKEEFQSLNAGESISMIINPFSFNGLCGPGRYGVVAYFRIKYGMGYYITKSNLVWLDIK